MRKAMIMLSATVLFGLAFASVPTAAVNAQAPVLSLSGTRNAMPLRVGETVLTPAAFLDGEETLHLDGPYSNNAVGFNGAATWYSAVRLTPTVTCTLSAVIFYQRDASVDDYVFVYGPGTATTPGPVLDSVPYSASGTEQWKRVELSQRIELPVGVDIWMGPRIVQTAQCWPLGIDAGPAIDQRGDWINYQSAWEEIQTLGLDYNWNIRGIISHGAPAANDIAGIAVVAPAGTSRPVAITPKFTIRNQGSLAASDIPVTCWIESLGTRVYDHTATYAGPLAPRASADVSFTPDWTGADGNTYSVTMFSSLAGDENMANDTSRASVIISSAVWEDIALPTSPDRIVHATVYSPTNDRIYIIGGNPAGDPATYLTLNQEYNPQTNTWTTKRAMTTARGWISGACVKDKIYVIGGHDNSGAAIAANQ
jgi:hypothetical protein